MIATNIDHAATETRLDEPVEDYLNMLIHDVNNITHTVHGFAILLDMSLTKDGEIDPDLARSAVDAILNRTHELRRLMQVTAQYNTELRNQF